jgi:hypothetical protein
MLFQPSRGLTASIVHMLRSSLSLFEESVQARIPCSSGPAAAEAARKLRSWCLQMDLSEELETGAALFLPLPGGSSALSLGSEAHDAASSAHGG